MTAYSESELAGLRDFYHDSLMHNTLPFWLPRAIDNEHGGYLLMRDEDGSLLDDDKAIWFQGRFAWMLATLVNTVEPRQEWLEGALHGVRFLEKHGFDDDGRMFFLVARNGTPLRKRRYYFSEAFAILAFAATAKATGDTALADRARALFKRCLGYIDGSEPLPSKGTGERPAHSIGPPIIFLNVAQQLVETIGDPLAETMIDRFIAEIQMFVKTDPPAVMEQIAPDGSIIDHFDGRLLNPGHAIEGAWFILHESRRRGGDKTLRDLGLKMLDIMWPRGWDTEHGGIFSSRDVYGKPVTEYWHDMKFWWPHCEAIIATLLAYVTTRDPRYAQWHNAVHTYAHDHFPDKKHGEWFGYLHRDGTLSSRLKGNHFKGPFHIPRMQWYCFRLLDDWLRH